MALSAPEVRIAITGGLYSAPLGTAAPADASAALAADYILHGYSSDDGVTENNDDSVDNIVAWQNATTVRAARSSSTLTFATSLLQTRGSVLELYYPGSFVEANGDEWVLNVVPPTADPRVFLLDVIDGSNLIRVFIGNGEVTERGEIPYMNSGAILYPITITAYPDTDGYLMRKFSNDDAWAEDIAGS